MNPLGRKILFGSVKGAIRGEQEGGDRGAIVGALTGGATGGANASEGYNLPTKLFVDAAVRATKARKRFHPPPAPPPAPPQISAPKTASVELMGAFCDELAKIASEQ